ncbi:MAG TPA: TolC family protein [Burkholderiales bacterium]|nr:TolC family protein [Burkholderiales bacterium]
MFAILFLRFAPAYAQENTPVPDVVDLPAVLRLVRDASPRLSIERQAVAGAEANRITAGAYPNPTVSYGRFRPSGGQATLFEGSRQEQTTVELPLLIAGQRSARVAKAEREIEAARARVASGASSLAAEAGSAFVALLAAQEKAALLSTANEELVRLHDLVAGREAGGAASRYDLTRLQVELGGFRTKLEDAKADITDRAGNLAALLGLQNWRPRASGILRPLALSADTLSNPRERAATSPATIMALREETVAQSGVEVARRERWPVPSVSAGRSWTSEPFGAANFLGLSVEIPVLDTRRGPLAKAESEATSAALRRELAVAEVATNLERYANVIAARQAALQRFQEEASARLPLLKQMAEDAYRFGRSSIFELLDSTRSRYELHQTRIDLVAALFEAQLRFLATSGDLERSIGLTAQPPR